MTKRRNFSDKFKAAVALEALRGDNTVQEIAAREQSPPTVSVTATHTFPTVGLIAVINSEPIDLLNGNNICHGNNWRRNSGNSENYGSCSSSKVF
jgi:hypothetical protein